MNRELELRVRVLIVFFFVLTMFYIYFVLSESAVIEGVSVESDELRQATVNLAQWNSVIEGTIYDCEGSIITSASDTGMSGYCYHPSFSYLVGYNNGTNTYGLRGRYQKTLHTGVVGKRGASITLTARADVQDKAASILSESGLSGSIIVLDISTGRIIALASRRGMDFNVNDLSRRYDDYMTHKEFFFAPGYRDTDPPGSTFKMITACAILEEGMDGRVYSDTGEAVFNGITIHNAGGAAYGEVDLQKALNKSVNTYFAQMAVDMGADALERKAADFMIGGNIELDFTTLESGFDLDKGSSVELAMTGFGQGRTLVTPMHIAMMAQSLANDGIMLKPYLIDRITLGRKNLLRGKTEKLSRTVTAGNAQRMRELLHNTAAEQYGFDESEYGYVCAKTGTAELGNGYDHIYMVTFSRDYVVMCSANDTVGRFGSNLGGWAKEMYKYLSDHPYESGADR